MLKHLIVVTCFAIAVTGCTATGDYAGTGDYAAGPGIRPIPGSITYGGQPRSRLTKAPVGSPVQHEFFNQFGQTVIETYIVQPDRSLKLVRRRVKRDWIWMTDD